MIKHYSNPRIRRKLRLKDRITGSATRPRLSVFRSNKYIYAQLIDDNKGKTIIGVRSQNITEKKSPIEKAQLMGELLAQKAQTKKIVTCVFDRGGYKYHGCVKALADGARKGGLKF